MDDSITITSDFMAVWPKQIREQIFRYIYEERERQERKWGADQSEDWGIAEKDRNATWYVIAQEEMGEVAEEILNMRFAGDDATKLRMELIQAAAVLVAWLEKLEEEE